MTAKWIVEKGSFEAPDYLGRSGWVDDLALATEFETEAEAQAAAVETGVDALRITEKDG